jgi:proteasome lid subunit RPN8/RPN11
MELTDSQKNKIKEQSLDEAPKECCGVIFKDGSMKSCVNKSKYPLESFAIRFDQFEGSELDNLAAFYHSHPGDAEFSLIDRYYAHKRNLPSLVYDVKNDKFNEYEPSNFFELPLIGRDFLTNEIDCITLVIDYYKRNLNLDIPDIQHPIRQVEPEDWVSHPEFWKYNRRNNEYFVELFEERGFIRVDEPKKYDLILSDNGLIKAFSHCAVVIGDGQVIHHPYPVRSEIESLSYFNDKSRIAYMRHKSLA